MSPNRTKVECASCGHIYIIERCDDSDELIVTCCFCGAELDNREFEDEMEEE
tara:strand:+ start:267 stop:422 length:156 start_codon:yes stop_codon:yes gene_type:complete